MSEQRQRLPRETEPLPRNIKPALMLLLFLAVLVGVIGLAAATVDWFIYG